MNKIKKIPGVASAGHGLTLDTSSQVVTRNDNELQLACNCKYKFFQPHCQPHFINCTKILMFAQAEMGKQKARALAGLSWVMGQKWVISTYLNFITTRDSCQRIDARLYNAGVSYDYS